MRPIDADELLTAFPVDDEPTLTKSCVRMTIQHMPTIEPQPEPEEFEWCTECKEYDQNKHCCHRWTKVIRETVEELKQAQPEAKEIGYAECANAMLKMWIDNVLTDGEYNRIMDKLNANYNEERRQDD